MTNMYDTNERYSMQIISLYQYIILKTEDGHFSSFSLTSFNNILKNKLLLLYFTI